MADEFTVNSYEPNWQDDPALVTFADGSYMIAWSSFNNDFDTSFYEILGQRFDASGNRIGGEFLIVNVDDDSLANPVLSRLNDGGFVVTFSYTYDAASVDRDLYAKVYNADFTERKGTFLVSAARGGDTVAPTVEALTDGGFRIFYSNVYSETQTFDDIYGIRFDSSGNATSADVKVNTTVTEFDQRVPYAIHLANGNLLAVWHSEASISDGTNAGSNELRGSLYSANGSLIKADFGIENMEGGAGDSPDPFSVTALNSGGFALARYETEMPSNNTFTYDVKLRLFSNSGVATTKEITVFAATRGIIYAIDVAQLVTGEIVVVWETPGDDLLNNFDDVQGRIYDTAGHPLTGIFNVAQDLRGDQSDPDVEALANGGFVVTYMSEAMDSDGKGIGARMFSVGPGGDINIAHPIQSLKVLGTAGKDILSGGGGNEFINGRLGNDILTGGGGADKFVFATKLNGKTNVDVITDFQPGSDDIQLAKAIFAGIGSSFTRGEFYRGAKAHDGNDHIIYNKNTGDLFYDSNGKAAGGQVKFAHVDPGTLLTFGDFLFV